MEKAVLLFFRKFRVAIHSVIHLSCVSGGNSGHYSIGWIALASMIEGFSPSTSNPSSTVQMADKTA